VCPPPPLPLPGGWVIDKMMCQLNLQVRISLKGWWDTQTEGFSSPGHSSAAHYCQRREIGSHLVPVIVLAVVLPVQSAAHLPHLLF
jgi:hypothetical protein